MCNYGSQLSVGLRIRKSLVDVYTRRLNSALLPVAPGPVKARIAELSEEIKEHQATYDEHVYNCETCE